MYILFLHVTNVYVLPCLLFGICFKYKYMTVVPLCPCYPWLVTILINSEQDLEAILTAYFVPFLCISNKKPKQFSCKKYIF